jgi:hypothetical protein
MVRNWGNPPIQSTSGITANPDTATLLAEVSSLAAGLYEVRWCVGGSTGLIVRLEQASSTSLSTTAIRDQTFVFTGSNQTSEFVLGYRVEAGDRFRALLQSSVTASVHAKISAEIFT